MFQESNSDIHCSFKMVLRFLVIALFYFIASGVTEPVVEWSYCGVGDKYMEVKRVTLNPAVAQPGKPLSTMLTGVASDSLDKGHILIDFPMVSMKESLCAKGRSCPLRKGNIEVPLTINVPTVASIMGGRKVKGTVKVMDAGNREVLCLRVSIPIAGKKREDAEVYEELLWLDQFLRISPPFTPTAKVERDHNDGRQAMAERKVLASVPLVPVPPLTSLRSSEIFGNTGAVDSPTSLVALLTSLSAPSIF